MRRPTLGNKPSEALLEVAGIEPDRVATNGARIEVRIAQAGERSGQRGHGRLREEPTGYTVHDRFERTAARQRNHRPARGLGL